MKLFQEFLMGEDDDIKKEVDVSGAVIVKRNDEDKYSILLIRRAPDDHYPNAWEFPRGRCSRKEDHEQCLKREVKEETGLDVDVIKYIDKFEYISHKEKRKSTQYNYLCKMKNPKQEVKLSKEHSEYSWIQSFGQVELMTSWSELKKTIAQVLNGDEIVNYPESKQVIEETQRVWKNF